MPSPITSQLSRLPFSSLAAGRADGIDSASRRAARCFMTKILSASEEDFGFRMSDFGSLEPASCAYDVHGYTRNPTSDIRNPLGVKPTSAAAAAPLAA